MPMQTTPLDVQFTADLARGIAEAGLKREDANELAKGVYKLFDDEMTPDLNPVPHMRCIYDLYDVKKWKPKKELQETYERAVKKS